MSNTDLDDLPPLRDVIADHHLSANKSLGQNFLLDQNITDKICRQIDLPSFDLVVEVGPGPGGLTRSLLRAGARRVMAIERDVRAVQALQDLQVRAQGRLDIHYGDAQDFEGAEFVDEIQDKTQNENGGGRVAIVANLPYNIATSLLVSWLSDIYNNPSSIRAMVLMFQKEVGQRILAGPGSKNYGRLSVLSQWLCDVQYCFELPPSAFVPPPKVRSCVLMFTPKLKRPYNPALKNLEEVTKKAFGQRRKMLRSSLKEYAEILESLQIDPQKRADDVSVDEFLQIAKKIS